MPNGSIQTVPKGTTPSSKERLALRLLYGTLQGALLYFLFDAAHRHTALAMHALFFVPALLVALYVPPAIIIGLGRLRAPRLLLWCALLAACVAAWGYHDAWRAVEAPLSGAALSHAPEVRMPSFQVAFFAGVFVFVSFALIVAGEGAKAWFAPYESYFTFSWALALQVGLALTFVGVFHLVLWTGAALFALVKLTFLLDLLRQAWFYVPVSAMAFATGLHIADVREDFIRGLRTLLLALMSWLLPLLALLVAGFLAGLGFTGLHLLWATGYAANLLLGVAALEIVLINTVFKAGLASEAVPRLLRVSARVACLTLPALTALAGYALALRIGQYGLTNGRVLAGACVLVASCYSLGYAWAALDRRHWLPRIAPVNVSTTWVSLAVLFALFTSVADPARLSVASQVDRLLAGRIAPDKFDFQYLRWRSAIYGRMALARLRTTTTGPNAAVIRDKSAQAAQLTQFGNFATSPASPVDLSRNLVSRMPDQPLPASFLARNWRQTEDRYWELPACLKVASVQCDAYLVALEDEHEPNVVLIPAKGAEAFVFGHDPAGAWHLIAKFSASPDCAGVRDALSHGSYRLIAPRLHDIEVNGQRIPVTPTAAPAMACPKPK